MRASTEKQLLLYLNQKTCKRCGKQFKNIEYCPHLSPWTHDKYVFKKTKKSKPFKTYRVLSWQFIANPNCYKITLRIFHDFKWVPSTKGCWKFECSCGNVIYMDIDLDDNIIA
jgi:hypothetical protein